MDNNNTPSKLVTRFCKENNICINCTIRFVTGTGFSQCKKCRDKNSKKAREMPRKPNTCSRCRNKLDNDSLLNNKKTCIKCRLFSHNNYHKQ